MTGLSAGCLKEGYFANGQRQSPKSLDAECRKISGPRKSAYGRNNRTKTGIVCHRAVLRTALHHLQASVPLASAGPKQDSRFSQRVYRWHSRPLRVAVTGSSSGIGLELVRQYKAAGARVYAMCRSPAAAIELHAIAADKGCNGHVTIHEHDQASGASCKALGAEFSGVAIDVLINNAGVGGGAGGSDFSQIGQSFRSIDYKAWANTMSINVFGVMRTTEALITSLMLSERPRLVHISGIFGSITNTVRIDHESPDVPGRQGSKGFFVYRSSKAALNMVAKLLDVELAPQGIASVVLHPGGVQTRLTRKLGKYAGSITPQQSVQGIRQRIAQMDVDCGLQFLTYDGMHLQW